jgi:1-acyl-sn-glycerol-3-phosphate acyltransferase
MAERRARKKPPVTALDVQEVSGELHVARTGQGETAASHVEPGNSQRTPKLAGLRARVRALRMRGVAEEVDGFGLDPLFCLRVAPVLEALFSRYWRVDLSGLENIPARGRVMLVGNHSGGLPYDGLMLMHGVRRRHAAQRVPRVLVEDDFWNLPFVGNTLARLGCVRANPDNAERLLRDDHVLAVFPEGTKGLGKAYRERYRLQRFGRGGFIKLALRTGTPILPVAVVGAEEVHPLLARVPLPLGPLPFFPVTATFPWLGPLGALPLPTRWSIRVGTPVDLGVQPGEDVKDVGVLADLTERVRSTIQRMVDDAVTARGGVMLG